MNDVSTHDGLTSLTERTPRSFKNAYAPVAKVLRYVLILLLFAVVAAILIWPELQKTAPTPQKMDPAQIASNELVKPTFQSIDAHGSPFTLSATRAVQQAQNPQLIDLEHPTGEMTTTEGQSLHLQAKTGLYRQNDGIMDLSGNVTLEDKTGYTFRGTTLRINMKEKTILTTAPVMGQGPLGSISAQGLSADAATDTIIFHGPARLILKDDKK